MGSVLESMSKHGMSNTKLYRKWADMIQRCNNKKSTNYDNYGKRGISVHKEWVDNFLNFYEWSINNGYEEGLTIDRINPNGNYEPSNCRWVTREVQDNNKTTNVFVTVNDETLTLSEVAKKYNIAYPTITYRYSIGDRGEQLISPLNRGAKRHGKKKKFTYKVTLEEIAEIKWLALNSNIKQKDIAKLYGISQVMVSKIKLNQFHSEIEAKKPNRVIEDV